MPWIEASIAFAATMMVFSSLISVIIETGHRLFRVRESGLQRLMGHMYHDILVPRLNPSGPTDAFETFKHHMTQSHYHTGSTGTVLRWVDALINAKQLTSLSSKQFIERLATTGFAPAIKQATQQNGPLLTYFLDDLISHYENIGDNASVYFKRRAGLFSIVLALLLVFGFNLNAVALFQAYLQHHQETSPTTAMVFPIGWDNAPWHHANWVSAGTTMQGLISNSWNLLYWLSSLFISAMMIGLGGPFWFDMYKKLSMIVGIHHKPSTVTPAPENSTNWVAVFERAIQANGLPQSTTVTR